MDSNGRQRNNSASQLALPSSSTFRRLPTLGRSPFRRADKVASASPSPEATASPRGQISPHHRVSTFPSLSRVLVDETSASSSFFTTSTSTPLASSGEQFGDIDNVDGGTPNHLLLPSRTSSLPQTPSPQPPNDPLDTSGQGQPSQLPGQSASRHGMTTKDPPPLPAFPNDLEPVTYPIHLAQTRPPDVMTSIRPTTRQRDFTMGSGATILLGAVHSPIGLGEPGSGGPPTGVPKRKESITAKHDNRDTLINGTDSWSSTGPVPPIRGSISASRVAPDFAFTGAPELLSNGGGIVNRKDGETGSGAEIWSTRRRGTTRSSGKGPETMIEARNDLTGVRDRERSRKINKAPSIRAKVVEPLLPSAKGISKAPASAMYFSPLPFHGRPPGQGLRAHTGTLVGDRIWFIGGVDGKTCWRGVAWFDTESLLWSTVETYGEQFPPLRAHTTTLVGPRLYIFGGGDGPTYSNDVWIFDMATHRFSRAMITTPRASLPPPRRAHTTILYRNFLVVFGGGNGQAALNDVWALDVSDSDRLTWHEWRTKGDVPQRKGYHTANLVGDKMIVFGGSDGHASFADVYVLNLHTLMWTLVDTEMKHNRLSHTSTQVGSYLFIIGGHNGQTYTQDVLLLNLGKPNAGSKLMSVTLQWESKTPRGIPPPGRGYHVAISHDARIFISGGYNGEAVFEDLWVLDLSANAYLPQVTTFEIQENDLSHQ